MEKLNNAFEILEKIDNNFKEYKYIVEGFHTPFQPQGDEMFFFTAVPKKILNVGTHVLIDEYEMYKQYRHPLCVYVRNGNEENSNWLAISVSPHPNIINGVEHIKVNKNDLIEIKKFIQLNWQELTRIANKEITSNEFFRQLKESVNKGQLLTEMPVVRKSDSKLPVDLWLEFIPSVKNHSLFRFKFQAEQGVTNTHQWPSINFGVQPPHVDNMPKKTFLRGKDINQLLKFAQDYREELKLLVTGQIDYDDFIDKINNKVIK